MNNATALRTCIAAIGCLVCALSAQCTGDVCSDAQDCEHAGASSLVSSAPAGGALETRVVTCTDDTTGASASCGSGLGCCLAATPSCGTFDECVAASGGNPMQATYHECDGPEDCEPGEQCWQEKAGTMCAAAGGYLMKCHSSDDCPAESPVCTALGNCSSAN